MIHVKEIKNLVDQGQYTDAHEALDNLLALGPGNLEASKLKCLLYAYEGRFAQEAQIWERIITSDPEDIDAIYYFQNRHLEERESYYFTDHIAGGGRRFLAHPRAIINSSLAGLFGCLLFLLISSYAKQYYFLASPLVSFGSFGILVLLPWFFILYAYFKSLRDITIDSNGICASTRSKNVLLKWDDIDKVYLTHSHSADQNTLSMVFMPKDTDLPPLEVNLAKETSAIRARTCFIDEVTRLFQSPLYSSRDQLKEKLGQAVTF